eukprot:1195048-Prorocentrum_minimum.AAC.9
MQTVYLDADGLSGCRRYSSGAMCTTRAAGSKGGGGYLPPGGPQLHFAVRPSAQHPARFPGDRCQRSDRPRVPAGPRLVGLVHLSERSGYRQYGTVRALSLSWGWRLIVQASDDKGLSETAGVKRG